MSSGVVYSIKDNMCMNCWQHLSQIKRNDKPVIVKPREEEEKRRQIFRSVATHQLPTHKQKKDKKAKAIISKPKSQKKDNTIWNNI